MSTTTTSSTTAPEGVINASDILAQNKFSSHLVEKEDSLLYDLGNLCAFDFSSLNKAEYNENPEEYINKISRDNVQLLITRMFQLDSKVVESGALALLPKPLTPIPRMKPIPEAKQQTRWEAFAAIKDIKKRKKDSKVWDETHKEWRHSWGYKRANDEGENFAMYANPNNPEQDPFQKLIDDKKERVDKNKRLEQRNLDESHKRSSSMVGSNNGLDFSKENRGQIKNDVRNTLNVAKVSTASMGKFDKVLEGDKKLPTRGVKRLAGLGDNNIQGESENSLKMVKRILNKEEGILNVDKATNQFITNENKENMKKKFKDGGRPIKKSKK
ncbi:ribosome biogenesis regulatory protein [Cavenderia fasciculata]|uniref:Ribosome biogenesis regulatory protein n=1 Tax=Cavenderia fasciculata TaxID=261658 RepID=F4PJ72_CACFS|nr:ribosome biogenesis regulatory protein [Cavenderia fasciculata]EGG24358.1 ribosome biogenesis regulatory protein [Cavenderia fasciculata]|eukprot:XP_004362209.1 ribosome biogenesis regulatory protein [Cavenderia fasciculata]